MEQNKEEKNISNPKKNKSYIKKTLKGIFYVVVFLIALNVTLYGLLSIPVVQQKLLGYAVGKIKEIVKTEVKVEEIRLSLFNNVSLKGVYIEDQAQDTLLYVGNFELKLSPWELLSNRLIINKIKLENIVANINQKNPDADFNFQFLIDAFVSDTTNQTDSSANNLVIKIEDVKIRNGEVRYDVFSEPTTVGEFNSSHIHITDLDTDLELPSVIPAQLDVKVASLSFKEKSGLILNNLKTNITSNITTFYLIDTELNLPKSKILIPNAEYNLLTNHFKVSSDISTLSPSDLRPFMPDLKFLTEDISFQTSINGKLPSIAVDSLVVDYGDKAHLRATASMADYSNYGISNMNLSIHDFQIMPSAVTDFARLGDSSFVAPDMLVDLGSIRLKGSLSGKLENLKIESEAWTRHGSVQLNLLAKTDTTFEVFSTKAKLHTQNFNLGSLLKMPEIGRLSGDVNLLASQTEKESLKAEVKGEVFSLQYNKRDLRNIPFSAYYNSEKIGMWLDADLPEGKLKAKVDMTQEKDPTVFMDMDIQDLKIDKFYPIEGWSNPELTMQMKGNVKGTDLKNIRADVSIDNFKFSRDSLIFKTGLIHLQAGESDGAERYINLRSSFLNANVTGNYNFETFIDELTDMMSDYLPGLFKKSKHPKLGKNKFDINVSIFDIDSLSTIFDLPINLIEPLDINASVNTIDQKLNILAKIPDLKYGEIEVKNTILDLTNNDSIIDVNGKANLSIDAGDIAFDLKTHILSDTIKMKLAIKKDTAEFNLDALFEALVHFEFNDKDELVSSVQFLPTSLDVGLLKLSFLPAFIENEGNRTSISDFGFLVDDGRKKNKYFGVDGVLSDQKSDTLNISFHNSDLDYLLKAADLQNITATLNGDIKLVSILDKPELYTNNFGVYDISFFNDTLGNLDIKSVWSEKEGGIKFKATLGKENAVKKSTVLGLMYPEQDSLDLRINLEKFSLGWTQPFVSDMLNKVSGTISSQLQAVGKISSPSVSGWLSTNDTSIGVDYTNVIYHLSDTIQITPDKIGFDNLIVEDPKKNKARISATITHKNFDDIRYKLNANLTNFMVLNTESRTDSLFYGKIFASGSVEIDGSDKLIQMNMKLRNAKNSKLNIQIPQASDAVTYQSIVYINTLADETEVLEVPQNVEALPLKLKLDLTVTPDLLLNVIINPLTGDHMEVKGNGLIDFTYDMRSEDMSAIGNYTLTDGFVKLKLQNLASIEFKIEQGSKLVFNGDPQRTTFDINAYKRVKADLTTLDSSFGSDQYNSPKVQVDCYLGIKGNIDKMNLTYDIRLPNANDDVQQRVNALISTQEQKIRQFAYLVAIGSFYPQGSSASGNVGQGILTNVAATTIGNVLNTALGKVIGGDWDIGTNISSENGTLNNLDVTVSVSRKFIDDKLQFNTNLGYRTDQTNNEQFVGDFDVTYALTRSIMLKVFNKTNDTFYKQAPTTQGVGIVYTKEAKTIKELFRFVRKRRNLNNINRQTTSK